MLCFKIHLASFLYQITSYPLPNGIQQNAIANIIISYDWLQGCFKIKGQGHHYNYNLQQIEMRNKFSEIDINKSCVVSQTGGKVLIRLSVEVFLQQNATQWRPNSWTNRDTKAPLT